MSADLMDLTRARELCRSGLARTIRLSAGASQSELAERSGAAISTISRGERGQRVPRGEAGARYGALLEQLVRGTG